LNTHKRPKDIFDLLDRMAGADLSLPERAVMIQQYKYADRDGTNSYVSEARLAEDLHTTDKTVRNHRAKLRTKGWLIERKRGHNRSDGDRSSVYDVVIPQGRPVTSPPKRKPNNRHGWNGYRKNPSSNSEPKLQEGSSSKPSSREEEFFHLPTGPRSDVKQSHSNGVPVVPGKPNTASADAEREDPWVSGGTVVGSKEGHPQKNKTPVDRSTVDINNGDALPGRPVVGPLKGSACGGDPMRDISKEGAIMCLLCNRPIDLGRYAAIPFGGGSAHSACIELADKDSLGCPHCPRGDFATAEELNAHVRVHHQPPLEAEPPWG
jgi:hypothetical protein